VTLPELFAIGDAVADTPPTVSARIGRALAVRTVAIIVEIYFAYL
jgi:hypothetical protein|tara:strand:- start:4673 stop:4807 length:135 start_codon:yes stop_codon:yes gene_type:complete